MKKIINVLFLLIIGFFSFGVSQINAIEPFNIDNGGYNHTLNSNGIYKITDLSNNTVIDSQNLFNYRDIDSFSDLSSVIINGKSFMLKNSSSSSNFFSLNNNNITNSKFFSTYAQFELNYYYHKDGLLEGTYSPGFGVVGRDYIFFPYTNGRYGNSVSYQQNFDLIESLSNGIYTIDGLYQPLDLSCEIQPINHPYNFDVKQGSLTDFIVDDGTSGDNPPLYAFKEGGAEYQVSFKKSKNFNNFNSGSILDENSSYSFKNIFTTSRYGSEIKIDSLNKDMQFLYLDGDLIDDEFYFRSCGGTKEDYKPGQINTSYTFNSTNCIEIAFNKSFFGENTIKDLRFGQRESQIIEREICEDNDSDNVYVDGEIYEGDIDNIGGEKPNTDLSTYFPDTEETCGDFDFSCHLKNFFNPNLDFSENTITRNTSNYIIDKLNSLFGLSDYFQYLNLLLPNLPDTNISLPFPYLNNNFQISLKYVDTEIPAIEDKLNTNGIEKSFGSKVFISFLIVIGYVLFRIGVLYGIFYIFRLYYKYIILGVSSLFGPSITKTDNGNFISFGFYVLFLIFIFGTFLTIFGFVLQLDVIISTIINYGTTFFTFLSISFGEYTYFRDLTNLFFSSLITGILLYAVYLLTTKFLRVN